MNAAHVPKVVSLPAGETGGQTDVITVSVLRAVQYSAHSSPLVPELCGQIILDTGQVEERVWNLPETSD